MAVHKDPRLVDLLDGLGPGAHLRKVREEANMSIDKVASALMLHPHTVETLEADAYERLPAPAFVRGYLRGYARVLGLPSRPILDMFDRQGFEPPPLTPDVTESQQAHTSDTAVRLVTYAVAVVLVVLVALWWHSQEDGGFGISGDLFDRSPESERDPALAADEGAAMATGGGEDDSETIGTASDGMDALSQGIEPFAAPSSVDAEDAAGATESVEPNEASRSEEPTPGDPSSADTAPADTVAEERSGATASPPSDSPPEDVSAVTTDAAGDAASEDPTSAEAIPAEADTTGVTESREASTAQDSSVDTSSEADAVAGTARDASVAPAPAEAPGPGVTAAREASATPSPSSDPDAEAPAETAGADTAGGSAGTSLAAAPGPNSTEASRDSAAAPTAGPETVQSGLVLEFVHESWVEVYDSERIRLFFGLVQPGRVLSFDGAQPFDVLLGFGNDVRVTIDGQAFDHTPYLKHGVGRFSVGTGAEVDTGSTGPNR